MSDFEAAFESVVGVEGGYSNDPKDSGGETMYGITIAVAREFGYTGHMKDLPLDLTKEIYRKKYWNPLQLDRMPYPIAHELFDTGVNQGIGTAAKYLQRCLNAFNREQYDYPDLDIDGRIGAITLACLNTYLKVRGAKGVNCLLVALNCLQGAGYIELVEKRQKDEHFLFGWIYNRVKI